MIATMEKVMILEEADRLSDMILQSDLVEYYITCYDNLKKNKDAQKKIKDFIKIKEQYEEVKRFGIYHPDYKRVMKEVRVVKRVMDLDPFVAEFKKVENDLQQLLDQISSIIGHAVSEHIMVPTGDPFFHKSSSCSGGCGTGCS